MKASFAPRRFYVAAYHNGRHCTTTVNGRDVPARRVYAFTTLADARDYAAGLDCYHTLGREGLRADEIEAACDDLEMDGDFSGR